MKDFFTHQDLFTCQNTADFHSAVEGSSINGIRLVPFENLVSSLSLMLLIIDQTSVQRRVVFDSSGQSCIGSPSSAASTTVGKMSTNSTLLMQKIWMMMMMTMRMRRKRRGRQRHPWWWREQFYPIHDDIHHDDNDGGGDDNCYYHQLFHFEAAISAARNVEEKRGVVCHLVIGIFASNFVSLWLFAF